jgi:hypothetical protein
LLLAAVPTSADTGRAEASPNVRLELTAGEAIAGVLRAIAQEGIRIEVGGQPRDLPAAEVRRLVRDAAAEGARPTVRATTRDGGLLSGTGCRQVADRLVIDHPEGPMSLPLDRIARVAWLSAGEDAPAWLDALPESPTADLVVVRRDEGHTFVECAVTALSDEAVTVVLDGETIPVKRAKVAGIVWLRPVAAAATGPVVTITDGRLVAARLRWSPEEFVVDDAIDLPPAVLESIDFAVARTIPLASLEAESTAVEPAFGGLAAVKELAGFFAPRPLPSGDGPPDLAIRPRTVATWRVPANSRLFRALLIRDVPATSPAIVDVRVAVDDRQAFHARLAPAADRHDDHAAAEAIEVDVSAARRLTVSVDFAGGSLGCPVRLIEPVFEQ